MRFPDLKDGIQNCRNQDQDWYYVLRLGEQGGGVGGGGGGGDVGGVMKH